MVNVLSAAGRAFLMAFGGSLLILAPGVLEAPNLNEAYVLGIAALIASISAGIVALQEFVPQLSFVELSPKYGAVIDAFVRAALAAFLISIQGVLNAPDLATAKSLATAALIGAATAGLRALRGLFSEGEYPAPQRGF